MSFINKVIDVVKKIIKPKINLVDQFKGFVNDHIIDFSSFDQDLTKEDLESFLDLIENNKNISYVKFNDKVLQTVKEDEILNNILKSIKKQLIENIYLFETFTNDYVLGMISKYVYNFNDLSKAIDNYDIFNEIKMNEWIEIETDKEITLDNSIYFCKIYKNDKQKQLVIAFQGFKSSKEINSFSIKDICDKIDVNYNNIKDKIKNELKNLVKNCNIEELNLSITGYAFGAWFVIEFLNICKLQYPNINVKSVVFESIGSKKLLEYFIKECKSNIDINDFNIKVYLSEPNFFNTCNTHFGHKYVVVSDINLELTYLRKAADSLPNNGLENIYLKCKKKLQDIFISCLDENFEILEKLKNNQNKNYNDNFKNKFENFRIKKFNELKKTYTNFSFYIGGLQSLSDKRLEMILKGFIKETQTINDSKAIKVWPNLRNSQEINNLKMYYNETLNYLDENLADFKQNTYTNKNTNYELYNDEFDYFKKPNQTNTIEFYMFQLNNTRESEINSKFKFVKDTLIHLKELYRIESDHQNNLYKFISNNQNFKLADIRRIFERLVYVDKNLRINFRILSGKSFKYKYCLNIKYLFFK